ncbi:MAG: hypothetical protein KFH87_12485 [Bacteroidetes bacterium]|nr:hypothetical protein [Bacteroidota bacterium]
MKNNDVSEIPDIHKNGYLGVIRRVIRGETALVNGERMSVRNGSEGDIRMPDKVKPRDHDPHGTCNIPAFVREKNIIWLDRIGLIATFVTNSLS